MVHSAAHHDIIKYVFVCTDPAWQRRGGGGVREVWSKSGCGWIKQVERTDGERSKLYDMPTING